MRRSLFLFLSATLLTSSPALFADARDRDYVGRIASVGMLLAVANAVGLIAAVLATGLFSGSCCDAPYQLSNVNGKGNWQCKADINGTVSYEQPYSCGRLYWTSVGSSIGFAVLELVSFVMVITVVAMNSPAQEARTLLPSSPAARDTAVKEFT